MIRLVLLLALAQSASAQTGIEALYGTWEITRDTVIIYENESGPASSTILYETVELSERALVQTSITDQPGFGETTGYSASEMHYGYRPDGLVLTIGDTATVELRLVGDRLGMTWSTPGTPSAEALYDRTAPHALPEALLGTWLIGVVDNAHIAFEAELHITEAGILDGGSAPIPLRVMDGYLLTSVSVVFGDDDPLSEMTFYKAAPYRISADGRVLTRDAKPTERWYRP